MVYHAAPVPITFTVTRYTVTSYYAYARRTYICVCVSISNYMYIRIRIRGSIKKCNKSKILTVCSLSHTNNIITVGLCLSYRVRVKVNPQPLAL